MHNKKSDTRFTIKFSRTDPSHLRVAHALNKHERYGKAQFIVDAVTYFLDHGGTSDLTVPARLDEKHIESVIN